MESRIQTILREKSFIGVLKYFYSHRDKKARLQDEIDSLHFYLNKTVDIRKFPKAEGALRNIQIADAYLLDIFDSVCKKYNCSYWIAFGTLLGAFRHEGVIPWDDDIDVCMLRSDYDRYKLEIKSYLAQYGVDLYVDDSLARLGIGYKHEQTGIWMDIFPADCFSVKTDQNKIFINKLNKYGRYYLRKRGKKSDHIIENRKHDLLGEYNPVGNGNIIVEAFEISRLLPHIGTHQCVMTVNEIFPLKRIRFENTEVNCPNMVESVLEKNYGQSFGDFPKIAVPHHGNENGKLWQWALKSNIDMEKTNDDLRVIATRIRNDVK